MNLEEAASLLPLHRPGKNNDSRVQKAVRTAEGDAALAARLRSQQEFDTKLVGVIHSIKPPEDLRAKLRTASAACEPPKPKLRSHALHPVVVTALLGVLLIAGFIGWTVLERMERFDGREMVESILTTPRKMSGLELDQVAATAGAMQDWFYMRGFEGFTVPAEVAALPIVGSRVYRIDGHPIAQLAVERNNSIVYVFRASDFAVNLEADQPWRVLQKDEWVGAIRRQADVCTMLAFRGTKADMAQFLDTLK